MGAGDVIIPQDNAKFCIGAAEATDTYLQWTGSQFDIYANGVIDLAPVGNLEINGVAGWTGTFTNGDGATVTVSKGIITGVA